MFGIMFQSGSTLTPSVIPIVYNVRIIWLLPRTIQNGTFPFGPFGEATTHIWNGMNDLPRQNSDLMKGGIPCLFNQLGEDSRSGFEYSVRRFEVCLFATPFCSFPNLFQDDFQKACSGTRNHKVVH